MGELRLEHTKFNVHRENIDRKGWVMREKGLNVSIFREERGNPA